jgi:hypothetical protein
MSQAVPTYGFATGKPEKPIVDAIVKKYGAQALSWPIVLSKDDATLAYLYERNAKNQINTAGDDRPKSASGVPSRFLDYTSTPRVMDPSMPELENKLLATRFPNSYDFILAQNEGYSTVDLDYVWKAGEGFQGFELTTFFTDFSSEMEAKRLVSMMNRRPSWQGKDGAHALHKIAAAAADLNVDFKLVCVNTIGKGIGSPLKTNGNVLYFSLTKQQIDRLSKGKEPENAVFCSFQQFLSGL